MWADPTSGLLFWKKVWRCKQALTFSKLGSWSYLQINPFGFRRLFFSTSPKRTDSQGLFIVGDHPHDYGTIRWSFQKNQRETLIVAVALFSDIHEKRVLQVFYASFPRGYFMKCLFQQSLFFLKLW